MREVLWQDDYKCIVKGGDGKLYCIVRTYNQILVYRVTGLSLNPFRTGDRDQS